MRLGVLFSGGKDSCLAYHKATRSHEVVCLLTIESDNPDSYMFHTPAITWTHLQAQALEVPLITCRTDGEKENELADLEGLMIQARDEFAIQGIVTGAVASVYQATRVQRICAKLGLWCFNPLWQYPQQTLLEELVQDHFEVIVVAVAAGPLGENWLGRRLDGEAVIELLQLEQQWGINPAGEGGELETFVTNGPLFRQAIHLQRTRKHFDRDSGVLEIQQAVAVSPSQREGPSIGTSMGVDQQ